MCFSTSRRISPRHTERALLPFGSFLCTTLQTGMHPAPVSCMRQVPSCCRTSGQLMPQLPLCSTCSCHGIARGVRRVGTLVTSVPTGSFRILRTSTASTHVSQYACALNLRALDVKECNVCSYALQHKCDRPRQTASQRQCATSACCRHCRKALHRTTVGRARHGTKRESRPVVARPT